MKWAGMVLVELPTLITLFCIVLFKETKIINSQDFTRFVEITFNFEGFYFTTF